MTYPHRDVYNDALPSPVRAPCVTDLIQFGNLSLSPQVSFYGNASPFDVPIDIVECDDTILSFLGM